MQIYKTYNSTKNNKIQHSGNRRVEKGDIQQKCSQLLLKRCLADTNYIFFVRSILNSLDRRSGSHQSIILKCSIHLKRTYGVDFFRVMYIVYGRLLPFIVAKPRRGRFASGKKQLIIVKCQLDRAKSAMASKWFRGAVSIRSEKSTADRLCGEIADTLSGGGKAVSSKSSYYQSVIAESGLNVAAGK